MDPAEVEFLSEKEIVSVVPNFSQDKIYLIAGDIGPFNAGLQTDVPLWLAITLKQRQRCRILPPEWMTIERLEAMKNEEQESKYFTMAPNKHFLAVTQLILQYASDDVIRADDVRTLVKDIADLRAAKLRSSIDVFLRSEATHAKLNQLTLMELNTVRPLLSSALNQLHLLRTNITH